jgi:3-oxoacyl-ACP reductase-like protein
MTPEDHRRVLADLTAQEADLAQKLSRVRGLIEFVQEEAKRVNGTQSQNGAELNASIYSNAKTLAEMSKICLRSVNGAGLNPKEIADRLIEANAVGSPHGLSGHISTALRRRMNSALSPDREIEVERGRYYYRPARPAPMPSPAVHTAQTKTMSKREVCEYLGKSKRTVETYITRGKLQVKYFNGANGRTAEFQRPDVEALKRGLEEHWDRNI